MPIEPQTAKVLQLIANTLRGFTLSPSASISMAQVNGIQAALDAGTQPPAQDFSQGDQGGAV
jgi:hypothetical protein